MFIYPESALYLRQGESSLEQESVCPHPTFNADFLAQGYPYDKIIMSIITAELNLDKSGSQIICFT